MQAVTTIGLDIAKSVFQVHGIVLVRWRLACHISTCLNTLEPVPSLAST
jgi:hypothetical protein